MSNVNFEELKLGSKFNFGKYQIQCEKPWDLEWEIVHQEKSIQIARTTSYIDVRQFDIGMLIPDTRLSAFGNGTSNFLRALIGTWLHSPTIRINRILERGFLYNFTQDEINCLTNYYRFELRSDALHSNTIECVTRIFLPTITQLGLGDNDGVTEGKKFDKYTDNKSRALDIHPKVLENIDFDIVKYQPRISYAWTISADCFTPSQVHIVGIDGEGGKSVSPVTNKFLIAPCIVLPRTGECN